MTNAPTSSNRLSSIDFLTYLDPSSGSLGVSSMLLLLSDYVGRIMAYFEEQGSQNTIPSENSMRVLFSFFIKIASYHRPERIEYIVESNRLGPRLLMGMGSFL